MRSNCFQFALAASVILLASDLARTTRGDSTFIFDGVVDNGPGDLNPAPGIIQLANQPLMFGNGTFTGTATESVQQFSDTIVITGTAVAALEVCHFKPIT
jgi:hypothetical protein